MAQMLVEPGRIEANLSRAADMVAQAGRSGCDIVVLPECLDAGWTHESARTLATPLPGPTTDRLRAMAADSGVLVAAGFTERVGDRIFNAAVLVSAQGEVLLHHRKINELDFARRIYSVGTSLSVASTPVGTVGLDICADNAPGSLALGESLGLMGAEILVSPSAWAVPPSHDELLDPYGSMWEESYAALARRHRMPVVGVSNVGPVVGGEWNGWRCIGCSLAVDRDGRVVARGPYGERAEELVLVTLATGATLDPAASSA
jgi:predicted amidohydrolase